MADLKTTYLGLDLKNPVMASSSDLTGTVKGVRRCVEAGAGAIVLKSLFEEEIIAATGGSDGAVGSAFEEEATRWLSETARVQGPKEYLEFIRQCRQEVDVPIIASVNGISTRSWVEYAGQIEHAGANALELNIALMPLNLQEGSDQIEEHMGAIVRGVRKATSLPITVKIGPWFTSMPRIVRDLTDAGADGVVLFNRFYQMDINPETIKPVPSNPYSSPAELLLPLRWTAILSPQINCDYSLSTGVHTGVDVVKALMAGAQVVQVASVLYLERVKAISTIISELDKWLDKNAYSSVAAITGKLAASGNYRPEELERLQFIKALTGRS